MRPRLAGILLAAVLGAAQAEDAPPTGAPAEARPALEVSPARLGYAFDQPEILLRQRLFGRAHGVSLLAAACLDLPALSGPVQDAYAAWHARQAKTIETLVRDLARYYFGSRADEANWPDLTRALNLVDSIEPALSQITLLAACASLPEALGRPRYELSRMLVDGMETAESEAVAVTSPRSGVHGTQSEPAPSPSKSSE